MFLNVFDRSCRNLYNTIRCRHIQHQKRDANLDSEERKYGPALTATELEILLLAHLGLRPKISAGACPKLNGAI